MNNGIPSNPCKACKCAYIKERNEMDKPLYLKRIREAYYRNRGKRLKNRKRYETRERLLKYQRAYRAKHSDKDNIRNRVKYALKTGKLQKSPCVICGDVDSQAHHDDYNRPLDVTWYCKLHHEAWHRIFIADEPKCISRKEGNDNKLQKKVRR